MVLLYNAIIQGALHILYCASDARVDPTPGGPAGQPAPRASRAVVYGAISGRRAGRARADEKIKENKHPS